MGQIIKDTHSKRAALIRSKLLNLTKLDVDSLENLVSTRICKTQNEKDIEYDDNHAEFSKDSEYLYALLWRDGWKKKNLDDCEKLIVRLESLYHVFHASLWELETLCNEMDLSFSGRFVRRRLDSAMMIEQKLWFSRARRGSVLTNYQAVAMYVVKTFSLSKQEEVRLLYLDREHSIKGKDTIAVGEQNFVNLEIKRLLSYALRADAQTFIVAHNHLGNDVNPSEQDISLTRRIEGAAELVGIPLFDHIIVCGTEWFSFRIAGLLEGEGREKKTN